MATEQTQKMITVTTKAAEKIKEFMKEEAESPEYLRVYVQGGGCSGLSYGMGFEKDVLINSKGNGWKNLNSRANLISGELELDTTVGMKGNTLILNASLQQAKHERQAYLEEASK